MFRKPKRSVKKAIRKRNNSDSEDDERDHGGENGATVVPATKKSRVISASTTTTTASRSAGSDNNNNKAKSNNKSLLHQEFKASAGGDAVSKKDAATRAAEYHPTETRVQTNKFHAGPIKASTVVRTTCRFDYQPDICKDYKETGFCGFGDTCIYLHDRGDTLSGWQLEQQWQEEKKAAELKKERQMQRFLEKSQAAGNANGGSTANNNDDSDEDDNRQRNQNNDSLPFACHICREEFKNPVVTRCQHYFCEKCIMDHVKQQNKGAACPICSKDTHGVFNYPQKLETKKRRLVGASGSWKEFMEAASKRTNEDDA